MYDRFKELGVPVSITRDEDVTLSPSERVDKILSFYGNDDDVVVLSNHLNAGGGTGAEVIYALRNTPTLATSILSNLKAAGINTRRVYQRALPRDNSKDYYFIHRNTPQTEALIVEYGFIDNPEDLEFLKENYKSLAEAVIKAVLDYKNIPYTPSTELSSKTYKVVKGDTLYSIANKFNTTVKELMRLNNLNTNVLSIGQELIIKDDQSNNLNQGIYTVKKGDSLYGIAKKFNTTVDKIKSANNLTTNNLAIGDKLIIPSETSIKNTYTVKSGDTLYSIAKKFNVSVDMLKSANNLTSNLLSIGDVLIIPSEVSNTYKVVKGDNLYNLARRFNTTVDELRRLNNLTTDILNIGDILIVR